MDDVKMEFDRHERGVCGKKRVADGDFVLESVKLQELNTLQEVP